MNLLTLLYCTGKEPKKPPKIKQYVLDHWVKLHAIVCNGVIIPSINWSKYVFCLWLIGCFITPLPFRRKYSELPHLPMCPSASNDPEPESSPDFSPLPCLPGICNNKLYPHSLYFARINKPRLLSLHVFTAQCTEEIHWTSPFQQGKIIQVEPLVEESSDVHRISWWAYARAVSTQFSSLLCLSSSTSLVGTLWDCLSQKEAGQKGLSLCWD